MTRRFSYACLAAGVVAAVIATIAPAIITTTVIIAAAAPNDNQKNDDPTTIVPAKTRITHTGDLLRVVNRMNRLHSIVCVGLLWVPAI